MMKKFRCVMMMLFALSLSSAALAKSNEQSLDRIVAVVNDAVITQTDLNKAIDTTKNQMLAANAPLPAATVLRKQVLNQLIDRKLQLQAAEQAGIRVKDEQLDQAIGRIAAGNNMPVSELYQKVVASGLSKTDYRKEIREEITLQQIAQQEAGSKITVTPDEVKRFMQKKSWQVADNVTEYLIEDLLVLYPDKPSATDLATLKQQAETISNKARQGTRFKDIATEFANNKSVEESDLGWRKLAEIPTAFANQIEKMKKGSINGPIETSNGLHIIRLVDMRQAKNQEPGAASPSEKQVEQMVYQQKLESIVKRWVARLRTQAVINMQPENA